jgi:hypothetical protein
MLMPATLSESALPFQPKTSDRRSGAAAQQSPARSGVTLNRIRPPKKTGEHSTFFIPKDLLFSSISSLIYPELATKFLEYPRVRLLAAQKETHD